MAKLAITFLPWYAVWLLHVFNFSFLSTGTNLKKKTAAIQFIETIDRTSLTISDEDFERHVESAVSAIAERHDTEQPQPRNPSSLPEKRSSNFNRLTSPHRVIMTEKSSISRPEVTPRNSFDAERIAPRVHLSPARKTSASEAAGSGDPSEEGAAVAGLLRSIQRPLSSIGRMFSDDPSSVGRQHERPSQQQRRQHMQSPPRRSSADPPTARMMRQSKDGSRLASDDQPHRRSSEDAGPPSPRNSRGHERVGREQMTAEDAAASHASTETAEAERIQRAEHRVIVEYADLIFIYPCFSSRSTFKLYCILSFLPDYINHRFSLSYRNCNICVLLNL